jgi:YaiO family outer membrane protein
VKTGRFRLGAMFGAIMLLVATGWGAMAADFETLVRDALTARAAGDFVAAETGLKAALDVRPDDREALLHLGLVQGFQGRHDEALATVRRGLAVAPGDFDLRLAAARIKGWMGRHGEAAADVEALLADFPGNPEALNLRGRLALYRGNAAAAKAAFAEALRVAPGDAEAKKGMADAETVPSATGKGGRIALGYSHSTFSRSANRDWREAEADGAFDLDDDMRLLGRAQVSHRFGLTDTYLKGGVERRVGPNVRVRLQAGATPDADFLARWTIEAGATARLSQGGGLVGPTEGFADLKHSHYATGDVHTADPGLQQYLFDGRAWLTARWLNSFDAEAGNKRAAGWSLRADWQALDDVRLFGGRADAPETESGATVKTWSGFAGIVFGLTPDVDLTVSYSHDNRKNTYIRDVVSATVGYRF